MKGASSLPAAVLVTLAFGAQPAYAGSQVPAELGELALGHSLRGQDALREMNRLHGATLRARDGYVAHYEKDGAMAMLYVAEAYSVNAAARQVTRMSERIRSGGTPFYHLKVSKQGTNPLYSVLGQGQIHYFYRKASNVVWLAADAAVARQALAALRPADEGSGKRE